FLISLHVARYLIIVVRTPFASLFPYTTLFRSRPSGADPDRGRRRGHGAAEPLRGDVRAARRRAARRRVDGRRPAQGWPCPGDPARVDPLQHLQLAAVRRGHPGLPRRAATLTVSGDRGLVPRSGCASPVQRHVPVAPAPFRAGGGGGTGGTRSASEGGIGMRSRWGRRLLAGSAV